MKKVYLVRTNSDLTEGRGHMNNVAAFTDRMSAELCAKNEPKIMGVGNASDIIEIGVCDSYDDFLSMKQHDLKERALSKLTEEEKEALGLFTKPDKKPGGGCMEYQYES